MVRPLFITSISLFAAAAQARPLPQPDDVQQGNDEINPDPTICTDSSFKDVKPTVWLPLADQARKDALAAQLSKETDIEVATVPSDSQNAEAGEQPGTNTPSSGKAFTFGSTPEQPHFSEASSTSSSPNEVSTDQTPPCASPPEKKRSGWKTKLAAGLAGAAMIIGTAMCVGVLAMDSAGTGSGPFTARGGGGHGSAGSGGSGSTTFYSARGKN